jgi:PhnB protein
MTETYPGVIPMLTYEDGGAALDWLGRAFGFKERQRLVEDNGRIGHAEMDTGGGVIMLASGPAGYESPARRRERYDSIRAWSAVPWVIDGVLVYVADVEQHYQRSKHAGARILSEPEDAPYGRLYRAEDMEGHRWMFMQPPST